MADDAELVTPVGRIIEGSVSQPSTKDYDGNLRNNPQYYIGLAIPKNDPGVQTVLQMIYQDAVQFYARSADVMSRLQKGLDPYSRFAWKISDGDHPKFADKRLYHGHYVFKFSTIFRYPCIDITGATVDPTLIKTGYYADVVFSYKPNGRVDQNAGVFLNIKALRCTGKGDEIVGVDANKLFASAAPRQVGEPFSAGGAQGFGGAPTGQAPQGFPGIGQGGGGASTSPFAQHQHQGFTAANVAPMSQTPPATGSEGMVNPSMSATPAFPSDAPQPQAWTPNTPLAPASDPAAAAIAALAPAQTQVAQSLSPLGIVSPSDDVPSLPGFADGSLQ